MNKKIESIQKSIDIFREMIEENSSPAAESGFRGTYYELTPRARYKKEHDASFKEIKETLLNSLTKKYDEKVLEERDSFITYVIPSGKKEDILDWKRILDILKENKRSRGNYFKFLRDLERSGRLDEKKYHALFTAKDLDRFLSDIFAEIIDDDSFPDEPPITEKQRNIIINKEESESDEEEEKNELDENSEQGENKLSEKINNLKEIITTLLEQVKEKSKLLKESSDQQENKKLEEEISQLEKTIEQKKQELEKLERQLNYMTEKRQA